MLREGVADSDFHPSSMLVMQHCKHVVEKGGVETATLHILGMLNDCLANFPTPVSQYFAVEPLLVVQTPWDHVKCSDLIGVLV